MGGCTSANGGRARATCSRAKKVGEPIEVASRKPDTSDMGPQQLFRMGIAEAQLATRLQKKDRLQHIYTARELLKAALQRCRPGEPSEDDLRTHLYAVLLKLGEDARALQSIRDERRDFHELSEDAPRNHGDVVRQDSSSPSRKSSSPAVRGDASDNSSEGDVAQQRVWQKSRQNDFRLLEGDEDRADASLEVVSGTANSSSATMAGGLALVRPESFGSLSSVAENPAQEIGADHGGAALLKNCSVSNSDGGEAASPATASWRKRNSRISAASSTEEVIYDGDFARNCEPAVASTSTSSASPVSPVFSAVSGHMINGGDQEVLTASDALDEDHCANLLANKGEVTLEEQRRRIIRDDPEPSPQPSNASSRANLGRSVADHSVGGSSTPSASAAAPSSRAAGRKSVAEPLAAGIASPPSSWGEAVTDEAIGLGNVSWPHATNHFAGWPNQHSSGNTGWPSPQWPVAGVSSSQWPAGSNNAESMPQWLAAASSATSCDGSNVADGKGQETPTTRNLRAVQPQQLGSAHIAPKRQQRRGAGSGAADQAQGATSGGDPRALTPTDGGKVVHGMNQRHTGRQPSQSSSSGSQGTPSDSEQSSVGRDAKRSGRAPFAPAIKEEPTQFHPPSRAGTSGADTCGGAVDGGDVPAPAVGKTGGFGGHSRTPSGEAVVKAGGFGGHSRTPSGEAVGKAGGFGGHSRMPSGEACGGWATPKHMTPASAGMTPSSAPFMEQATPSLESGLRNPLSQPELLADHLTRYQRSNTAASLGGTVMGSPGAQSRSSLDSMSLAGSCAPSVPPSPFCHPAISRVGSGNLLTPTIAEAAACPEIVSVRILSGVSGEEEFRFEIALQSSASQQHVLTLLDQRCKQKAGQTLSDLNWLHKAGDHDKYQRKKCDMRMVEEILTPSVQKRTRGGPTVLLLCTIPATPPSELAPGKIRLKNLTPARVTCGQVQPVRVTLETSPLEGDHDYTVAFTHQWSNMTYHSYATPLPNGKGVAVAVPSQMLVANVNSTTDGLYDVHLIVDRCSRSENRRTLTVVSETSELSSSSTAQSTAASGGFRPIC